MHLERHLQVLWRFRLVVAGGLVLGVLLATLAAYQISISGGFDVQRRGYEVWSSTSTVMVTQEGFPWGRVTLPATTPGSSPAQVPDQSESDRLQYADPTRFSNLALLYSVISHSDRVRAQLPGHPAASQIQAIPLDPTNSGQVSLPIISLTTEANSPAGAVTLNKDAFEALRRLLIEEQNSSNIPNKNRVLLSQLNRAQPAVLVQARSWTSSILAFLLCMIAAVALSHILEALRPRSQDADFEMVEAFSDQESWLDLEEPVSNGRAEGMLVPSSGGSEAEHEGDERLGSADPASHRRDP